MELPRKIDFWENDIDYVVFVDENGSSGKINNILKKITNNKEIDEDDKYFTITGCIFTKQNHSKAKKDIENLKGKYWENSIYYDTKSNSNKYVCFHSREIRRHDKAFNDKLIKHNKFTKGLTDVLEKNRLCYYLYKYKFIRIFKKRVFTKYI